MAYVIESPNKLYNGVTEGVKFENGVGKTEEKSVRDVLVNDYGYTDITPEEKPKKANATQKEDSEK